LCIYCWAERKKTVAAANSIKKKDTVVKSQRWVSFFIHRPYISFIIIAALAFLTWFILPKLETGFLPEMDEGSIVLDYASPPGTSLDETDRMLRAAEKIITAIPEVEAYSRRTGTEMGFLYHRTQYG
jgi:Cu/Ag efflux pump CusA